MLPSEADIVHYWRYAWNKLIHQAWIMFIGLRDSAHANFYTGELYLLRGNKDDAIRALTAGLQRLSLHMDRARSGAY
ncbi:MAG: hypothetical protein JO047_02335 [Alphaproteobacteria bacterium]|nr:hypothetical protein [Alphaproteobacteria bacterium]